jgi:hypothetical protein
MATVLDRMVYTDYIAHLKDREIPYTERTDVDIDYWMEEYVAVTPVLSQLKERYFSTDGGHQLF